MIAFTGAMESRMHRPVLRPARAGDVPAMAALVDAAYARYIPRMGRKPGPMLDNHAARVAAGQVVVAVDADGRLLGVLVLLPCDDGALLMDNVAVLPGFEGQGIGRALMRHAEEEALRRGAPVLRLYTHETMTENIALYSRAGYAEVARVEEKGFRRVYMEKRPR